MDTVLLFALVAGTLIGLAVGAVVGAVLMHDFETEYKYKDPSDKDEW